MTHFRDVPLNEISSAIPENVQAAIDFHLKNPDVPKTQLCHTYGVPRRTFYRYLGRHLGNLNPKAKEDVTPNGVPLLSLGDVVSGTSAGCDTNHGTDDVSDHLYMSGTPKDVEAMTTQPALCPLACGAKWANGHFPAFHYAHCRNVSEDLRAEVKNITDDWSNRRHDFPTVLDPMSLSLLG
jgi:hypothetical protein